MVLPSTGDLVIACIGEAIKNSKGTSSEGETRRISLTGASSGLKLKDLTST
jgi:hypothetical protein